MHELDKARRGANISESLRIHEQSMTDAEKVVRSNLHHNVALKAYKEHPDYREHVSAGTKRGMTPAVRRHLSEIQKGVPKPYKSEHTLKVAQKRMSAVGKANKGHHPWNYGKSAPDNVRKQLNDNVRLWYRVYINDKVIIDKLSNTGGHLKMAQAVGEVFGVKTVGRNVISNLINSGNYYKHKVSSKAFVDGLHFELIGKGLDCHS